MHLSDLFWTDHGDESEKDKDKADWSTTTEDGLPKDIRATSKTSSYLDLSPLYGSNQEMQDSVRTFKQGKLKADCFADPRLLMMPPGVGVILIMFNRFHNYVCDNLMAINEGGKFTPPTEDGTKSAEQMAAAWKKFDNDLFQTARLVTSGLYINITLLDYVRNIVNVSACRNSPS
jgi:Animal haem peroxidase